jgi:hypothetical protein
LLSAWQRAIDAAANGKKEGFAMIEFYHNDSHAGQIEYLRGLSKYDGWFPGAEKRSGN